MYFSMRLPPIISSFGNVISASVSGYASVKRGKAYQKTKANESVTTRSKLAIFHHRYEYGHPGYMSDTDLAPVCFYAFWRMYHVAKNRLVRHKTEVFVAITGTGWPTQAKTSHDNHADYARRTLYAYFPCPEFRGIDFIDEVCERDYGKSWSAFFKDFVEDAGNLWCPPWIARNYKVVNIDHEIKEKQLAKRAKGERDEPRFPSCNTTVRYVFESCAEPKQDEEDPDHPIVHDTTSAWDKNNQAPWQQHSSMGPNLDAEALSLPPILQEDLVNKVDYDWDKNAAEYRADCVTNT